MSDTAYAGSWDGVTAVSPSKNAVYDKIEAVVTSVAASELLANKDTDGTLATNSDTKYPSQKAAKTYMDAKVADAINDGVTTIAPSQNAVFDALALKTDGLIISNTQTASYTLALADKEKLVQMNVASANNLTVPVNSTIAFPVGTQILIQQIGAGQTTIVPDGGVTVHAYDAALKLPGQYGVAALIKTATNTWEAFGDLIT